MINLKKKHQQLLAYSCEGNLNIENLNFSDKRNERLDNHKQTQKLVKGQNKWEVRFWKKKGDKIESTAKFEMHELQTTPGQTIDGKLST